MAKAKNKKAEVVEVSDFPSRVKVFEQALIALIKEHKVGLRPELSADRLQIKAVLNYIDLAEIEKKNGEEAGE